MTIALLARSSKNNVITDVAQNNHLEVAEEMDLGDTIVKITGCIKRETEKAVLIDINNGSENWFPKSFIKSQFNPENMAEQTFLGDSWFLEKNKNPI
ncbi:MAG: hypothetical protein ACFE94_14825 [Candidatus Hodarchaeota archaeon]